MRTAVVAGTGSFLPGDPVPNEVVETLFGSDDNYLSTLLGTKYRYWATDPATLELRFHNSDLATNAGRAALEAAGLSAADVDLLIVNSCTPDYLMPAMAPIVQEKLGIRECAVIELRSGCAGSVGAIAVAQQFIGGGMFDHALVIASELASSHAVVPLREGREMTIEQRLNGIMFGDGAGAIAISAAAENGRGIERTCLNSVGCGMAAGMSMTAGGSSHPFTRASIDDGSAVLRHDHRAIVKWGLPMCVRAVEDLCAAAGVLPTDIDCFIFPQANASMMQQDRKAADVRNLIPEDKIVVNVDRVGNAVSAGLLIAFDDAIRGGRVKTGERVALIGTEASKWLYGAALIRL